jgi:hypothetical protein
LPDLEKKSIDPLLESKVVSSKNIESGKILKCLKLPDLEKKSIDPFLEGKLAGPKTWKIDQVNRPLAGG